MTNISEWVQVIPRRITRTPLKTIFVRLVPKKNPKINGYRVTIRLSQDICDQLGYKSGDKIAVFENKFNKNLLALKKTDDNGYHLTQSSLNSPYCIDFPTYETHELPQKHSVCVGYNITNEKNLILDLSKILNM